MVALFLFYLIAALVYPGGMGFGDVKLAGVLGLFLGFLGWGPLVVGAFAAFLLGGLFALVLVALRRAGRKSGIPFGPWMLAGAWVGIFFGSRRVERLPVALRAGVTDRSRRRSTWLTTVVGIDIGSTSLRAVEVADADKARPTLVRHHEVPAARGRSEPRRGARAEHGRGVAAGTCGRRAASRARTSCSGWATSGCSPAT